MIVFVLLFRLLTFTVDCSRFVVIVVVKEEKKREESLCEGATTQCEDMSRKGGKKGRERQREREREKQEKRDR